MKRRKAKINVPNAWHPGVGLELVLDRDRVDLVRTIHRLGHGGILVLVVGNDVAVRVLDMWAVHLERQRSSVRALFRSEWRHDVVCVCVWICFVGDLLGGVGGVGENSEVGCG